MKKILKICGWSLAFPVTLVVLFYVEENWRGARTWNRTIAELKTKGYPTTIAETIPSPIPDENNIAAAPIFAELYDDDGNSVRNALLIKTKRLTPPEGVLPNMNKGILGNLTEQEARELLSEFDQEWTPLLAAVNDALKRTKCRWPIAYEKGFETDLAYLSSVFNIIKTFQLRALSYLALGKSDKAADDIISAFMLAGVLENNPRFIDSLMAATGRSMMLFVFWQGIVERQWQKEDLLRLQPVFSATNGLLSLKQGLLHEQVLTIDIYEKDRIRLYAILHAKKWDLALLKLQPAGMTLSDKCLYVDTMLTYLRGINLEEGLVEVFPIREPEPDFSKHIPFFNHITKIGTQSIPSTLRNVAKGKVFLNQAIIAAALERYRIHHGKLPETLTRLVPEYLDKIPNQVVINEPMIFSRISDQDYILYSIGWNLRDDSGVVSDDPRGDKLDWVWASKPELYRIVQAEGQ